ncbi:MAG: NAD(P)/FAD-dependent oxidoreductase [Clostridia bacterium]|nr:NAD(P)/FAD-dependent oxidoreductase [Clostridia bacterium]
MKTDVLVIGAGAVGTAIARELTKYKLDVTCVDMREDVGGDCSKSNSAIIHTGYDAKPGTLESELVVSANPAYDKLTKDLDIPFERIGAILPAITDEQFEKLPEIKAKAVKNKVYDVEFLSKERILEMEPNINPEVKGGLFIPRESIIDPFLFVVAMAENAVANGAKFLLSTKVTGIRKEGDRVVGAETTNGYIEADYIINAGGLFCDEVASFVGKDEYKVIPRKGQFYILDKNTECKVNHIVLPIPTATTKGKLMTPTIHGNMLVGPTAEDLDDKFDKSTNKLGLDSIRDDVTKLIPNVKLQDTITQYAGLRANRNPEGLNIDTYEDVKHYVNLSGVRSTGLTNSISCGTYVANLLRDMGLEMVWKDNFIEKRKGITRIKDLPKEEQHKKILENPLYGNIVCRCETVTEGEIVDAIHSPIPATTVDAIKRRLRAGMGRCQGGFCGPKVIEIIARELGIEPKDVRKNNSESYMVCGKVK